MGSWVIYGLGSEARNLPGFVVLASGNGTSGGTDNYASGFLPSTYAGTVLRSTGDPILYLSNPPDYSRERQRSRLDALRDLNTMRYAATGDQEIESRIHAYELAFRMQASAPDLLDFSKESPATVDAYGVHADATRAFGTNCLLARRMVERGVRFMELIDVGSLDNWDAHSDMKTHGPLAKKVDQPIAGLLKDLKSRGLLDDTLVIWTTEFGRTPQTDGLTGRSHHTAAYSSWLAGAGVRGGAVIGKTDDYGDKIIEDPVHVHDFHATILHLLGFDHEKLTFRHAGGDFRLTDVAGTVVKEILA